jgi:hypothetical protein
LTGDFLHLHHEALLTVARKIPAAAEDGDVLRLEQAAELFLDALTTHVGDEAGAMIKLLPAEARILRRGQVRLLSLATELIRDAAAGCSESPRRCVNRTEEVLALLTLQARDERFALHDPVA